MFTVFLQLRHVPANCAPPRDLAEIIFVAATRIIAAIPLEPAARIVWVNPTFASPFRERLRCVYAEIIQRRARSIGGKLRPREPARREFVAAIGHVFPAEHSELEHLSRRQIGREPRPERTPDWFCAEINVSLLHFVVHFHPHRVHSFFLTPTLRFVQKAHNAGKYNDYFGRAEQQWMINFRVVISTRWWSSFAQRHQLVDEFAPVPERTLLPIARSGGNPIELWQPKGKRWKCATFRFVPLWSD